MVPVVEAGRERLGDPDLLVVGGPTHFHGMSRARTRKWAASTAQKPKNDLVLGRDTQGPGVRDCLTSLGHGHTKVAGFEPGEGARAQEWGEQLATSAASKGVTDAGRPRQPSTSTET